jgi:hypothetical protein
MSIKRAFLCGINYTGSSQPLNGCINDIKNINNFIVKNCGYNSSNIKIITDEANMPTKPTKQNMEAGFSWLIKDCKAGDTLLFYYSGHGATLRDRSGDESDGLDNVLVPLDYEKNGVITDDWIFTNVISKLPAGVTLWAFTDCCHSGTMLDLQFNLQAKCVYKGPSFKNGIVYKEADWTNQYIMNNENSKPTVADVYLFSGCLDPQTAADATIRNQSQGAFTSCFLEFLNRNIVKNSKGVPILNNTIKICDVLKEINCRLIISGFEQRSQLSMGKIQDFNKKFYL